MSAERTRLIKALDQRLVPLLLEKGFVHIDLLPDEKQGREIRFSFPLGRFRRVRAGNFELIEIQLDKRGATQCRLNLGVVPPEGIDHPVKHVPQSEACVHYLAHYCSVYSSPFFRRWFSPSILNFNANIDTRIDDLVTRICNVVPEIENWFESGKVGPHLREVEARTWQAK